MITIKGKDTSYNERLVIAHGILTGADNLIHTGEAVQGLFDLATEFRAELEDRRFDVEVLAAEQTGYDLNSMSTLGDTARAFQILVDIRYASVIGPVRERQLLAFAAALGDVVEFTISDATPDLDSDI